MLIFSTPQAIREAVREIQMEMPPLTPEAQEAFFQEQVAEGEKLATLGECWCLERCKVLSDVSF